MVPSPLCAVQPSCIYSGSGTSQLTGQVASPQQVTGSQTSKGTRSNILTWPNIRRYLYKSAMILTACFHHSALLGVIHHYFLRAISNAALITTGQLRLNVALQKPYCCIISSRSHPTHSVQPMCMSLWFREPVFPHTCLVLTGFVPTVDFLARTCWSDSRSADRQLSPPCCILEIV